MRRHRHVLLITCLLIGPVLSDPVIAAGKEIAFDAVDGIQLHGDLYTASGGENSPLILLFHQAGGDARGEYGTIIPRLVENGYSVLAMDQRSGGSRFGGVNRTVSGLGEREFGYCDAYVDLEATLGFAAQLERTGPIYVWGSSYSAGLILRLGVEHADELDGILAFSPASGGPMAACDPNEFIPKLSIPTLALRPGSEMKVESVREQFELFEKHGLETHVAEQGVHGSSMLVEERTESDTESTWTAVLDFLTRAAKE